MFFWIPQYHNIFYTFQDNSAFGKNQVRSILFLGKHRSKNSNKIDACNFEMYIDFFTI